MYYVTDGCSCGSHFVRSSLLYCSVGLPALPVWCGMSHTLGMVVSVRDGSNIQANCDIAFLQNSVSAALAEVSSGVIALLLVSHPELLRVAAGT